jgi:hypothetical protein
VDYSFLWGLITSITAPDMRETPGLQLADLIAWATNRKLSGTSNTYLSLQDMILAIAPFSGIVWDEARLRREATSAHEKIRPFMTAMWAGQRYLSILGNRRRAAELQINSALPGFRVMESATMFASEFRAALERKDRNAICGLIESIPAVPVPFLPTSRFTVLR